MKTRICLVTILMCSGIAYAQYPATPGVQMVAPPAYPVFQPPYSPVHPTPPVYAPTNPADSTITAPTVGFPAFTAPPAGYVGDYVNPHPSTPCGPDWLPPAFRGLVSQGCLGADFRPACRTHDACYTWPGWSRQACDRMYLDHMSQACNQSAWPLGCRIKASMLHANVRLFGSHSYRISRPWGY